MARRKATAMFPDSALNTRRSREQRVHRQSGDRGEWVIDRSFMDVR